MNDTPLKTENHHPMKSWQLDAFESQKHSETLGGFKIVREPTGCFDGKVIPSSRDGIVYVMGWLYGRDSANAKPAT